MTTTSARLLAPSLRRMPRRSRISLSESVSRACVTVGLILAVLLILAGCQSPAPVVITADRQIVHLPDGRYAVTETWLLERYEQERALRLRAEKCEAAKP